MDDLSLPATFTASDFLVMKDSTISRLSLFSSRSLHQPPMTRPKTKFTFSHIGWMADTECRCCSQATGPLRRKPQNIDPRPPACRYDLRKLKSCPGTLVRQRHNRPLWFSTSSSYGCNSI